MRPNSNLLSCVCNQLYQSIAVVIWLGLKWPRELTRLEEPVLKGCVDQKIKDKKYQGIKDVKKLRCKEIKILKN